MMWKDKYKIGVKLIDEQHKELFDKVSAFIQSVQGAGNWDDKQSKVKETLKFMQEYVVVHFADEEEYQREIGYPDHENHVEAHRAFKQAVADYGQRFESEGFKEALVQEFGGRLMTWLILHVAATDQKLGQFAKAQGGEE